MKPPCRLIGLMAAALWSWQAAAGPGFLPPWRDAQGPRLELHDPAGLRAVVEASPDLRQWTLDRVVHLPTFTNLLLRPQDVPPSVGTPEPFRAWRVRTLREGRVLFGNRVSPEGIDAPVSWLGDFRLGVPLGGSGPVSGAHFLAQLHVSAPGIFDGWVGQPVPFRTAAAAGYISNHEVTVPMADDSDFVTVMMTAWIADLGGSFSEAVAKGLGGFGISNRLTIRPAVQPGEHPTPLIGLLPFSLGGPISADRQGMTTQRRRPSP
jgi:hypothetical protein